MDFLDLVSGKIKDEINAEKVKFAVASGNFPKSGIALPLGNRRVRITALKQLYLYKGRFSRNWLKVALLRIFNFAFVWNLVFRKKISALSAGENNIFSFLASQIGSAEPVTFSVYVGSRKFILPLFGAKSGKMLGAAKVYLPGVESSDYGENEAKILRFLENKNLPGFLFPKVLAKDYFRGFFVVILSSPPDLKNFASITERHIDFLKQLSEKTAKKELFEESDFYKEFQREIDFLKSKIPERFSLIKYFCDKSIQNLKGKEFTFSLTKREFPFFEMFQVPNVKGQMFIIDWEQARTNFPAIFDLFSLMISGGRFKKGDYTEIYIKNLEDIFFRANEKTETFLNQLLPGWKINQDDAYCFFLLFLIDQLYIHLHVGHILSAERVIAFLEKLKANETFYKDNWFGGGTKL